jgi:hypothetical protein
MRAMKRRLTSGLIGLALLLGGPAKASGQEGASRFFYVFSTDQAEELERAHRLQELVRAQGRPLPVVALFRGARPAGLEGLVLLEAPEGRADERVLAGLRKWLGQDYVAIFDGAGRLRARAEGRHLERLFAAFVGKDVPTEVDESTWGKIKDLFK